MDEAIKCRETGEEKTILFGLTGTGYFDMYAYEKFNDGKMENYTLTELHENFPVPEGFLLLWQTLLLPQIHRSVIR